MFEEHEEASVAGAAGAGRRATDEYGGGRGEGWWGADHLRPL